MATKKKRVELSEPAKMIVAHLCREIIGPRHEIDWTRYENKKKAPASKQKP